MKVDSKIQRTIVVTLMEDEAKAISKCLGGVSNSVYMDRSGATYEEAEECWRLYSAIYDELNKTEEE